MYVWRAPTGEFVLRLAVHVPLLLRLQPSLQTGLQLANLPQEQTADAVNTATGCNPDLT